MFVVTIADHEYGITEYGVLGVFDSKEKTVDEINKIKKQTDRQYEYRIYECQLNDGHSYERIRHDH